jgi:hypothetical protein
MALIYIYAQLQVHVVQRITELRVIINQLVMLMTKRGFQAQNYNRIYLDYIHMDHIYTKCKGLKLYNGYSYWYLAYDMHQ